MIHLLRWHGRQRHVDMKAGKEKRNALLCSWSHIPGQIPVLSQHAPGREPLRCNYVFSVNGAAGLADRPPINPAFVLLLLSGALWAAATAAAAAGATALAGGDWRSGGGTCRDCFAGGANGAAGGSCVDGP